MTEPLSVRQMEQVEQVPQKPAVSSSFAVLMLALCCFLWGFSFPAVQKVMLIVEGATKPASVSDIALRSSFNGWRFTLAAGTYFLITWRRQRKYTAQEVGGGSVIGVLFAAGVLLQLIGLRYTLPSVSAFLTALSVVFAPLAQAAVLRRPVSGRVWCSVGLAIVGMGLLSYPANTSAAAGTFVQTPPVPFLGEILTVAGSVLFTLQILALDRYGQKADAARLTFMMLGVSGVVSLLAGLTMGAAPIHTPHLVQTLAADPAFLWRFAGLVLLCTTFAMHLMNRYQPFIAPAVATVVYCLEPVFGTGFSVVMGAESLTAITLAGGAAIIAAVALIARR